MSRLSVIYIFLLIVVVSIIIRLSYIQIVEVKYKLKGNYSSIQALQIIPNRGLIFDRNNILIVSNKPAYDLFFIPSQLKSFDTTLLAKTLSTSKDKINLKIKKASIGHNQYKEHLMYRELSEKQLVQLSELKHLFLGFYIRRNTLRKYLYPIAPHALGYIGEVNQFLLQKNKDYTLGDNIGISGIEKSYENELRGQKGVEYFQKNVQNINTGPYENGKFNILAISGANLTTTLDANLQLYAESLFVGKRGALVALEPSSGEILAIVSSPNYNPNLMVGVKRNISYNKLSRDSLSKPLFDRSLSGEYPPGSIFKTITALVAMQVGSLNSSDKYTCKGGFKIGNKTIACHCHTYWPIDLRTALSKSCNSYFSRVHINTLNKLSYSKIKGQDIWADLVMSFGLGDYLGNDFPTGNKGFIPNSLLYDKWYGKEKWNPITVISNAIGQGELLTTPIQLANVVSIIANKGWYIIPHIVKQIGSKPQINTKFLEKKITKIDPFYFQVIIDGMFDAVQKGTAIVAQIPNISVCAKTATSENSHGQDHSIFVAFSPKVNPKIALSVVIENGHWGSKWAAPIGSLVIEKYLKGSISKLERKNLEEKMLNNGILEEYKTNFLKKASSYGWKYMGLNRTKDSLKFFDGKKSFWVKY